MINLLQAVGDLSPGTYCLGEAEEARLICSGLARLVDGAVPQLNPGQVRGLQLGRLVRADGVSVLETAIARSDVKTSGLVKSGAGLLSSVECTAVGGTIKIYDSLTASGTVLLNTFDLDATGRLDMSIGASVGARFSTGCYVVLSNAAARVTLIFGIP